MRPIEDDTHKGPVIIMWGPMAHYFTSKENAAEWIMRQLSHHPITIRIIPQVVNEG